MHPQSPVPRAPRWLWVGTLVVAALVAAFAAYAVVELLDSDRDEPEGLADLASLVVVVMALPALGLLLVAIGLRRRSGHVVVPLLVTSLASGALLLGPVVATVPMTLLGGDPVPPYQAADPLWVVVYSHDPGSSAELEPRRLTSAGGMSERDRVDAAVNDLVGSPAPVGRRTFWSLPCTRTYTGVVSIDDGAVTVDLLGPPRSTSPRCSLTPDERRLRQQQLAWTVRSNLDDPSSTIRVREPGSGAGWTDLVADPAFVEHR